MARETDQCLGGQALVASINRDFKGTFVVRSEVANCQQAK
jgi:hypothetical protein